jgi:chromosome segregation ATPase
MKRIICSVVGLCFLAGSGIATAQSLADLAKKTQAQRKSTKRPSRVYTNADVPVTAAATAGTATEISTTPKEGEEAAPADPNDPNAKPAASKTSVNAADEANWRNRMTAAREAVSRAKEQLEGMRTRVLHLQTAKALGSNGDVNQQAAVATQQSAALQEFDRLRADLEKYQKALVDLEAEARAANVPAGWLR